MINSEYYEPLPLLFKYKNENNGHLYLTKFLNKKFNIGFNDLLQLRLSYIEKVDTSQILNYNNIYFIDLKKIKLVDNENLFKFINLILIKNNKSSYKFIKYDFNVLILFNLNYINENFISKLSNIIEQYQEQNNFIMFSTNLKINDNQFYKLKSLCSLIPLNPFTEFKCKMNSKNEKQLFKLLNYDITKYELLLLVAKKNSKTISKLSATELYEFTCNNILLYNILNDNLYKNEIYSLSFNLISMFPLRNIITYTTNLITYSTINKLNNKYDLKSEDNLVNLHKNTEYDTNISDIIKLKKFINYIKNILDTWN